MKYLNRLIHGTLFLALVAIHACKKEDPFPCFECITSQVVTANPVNNLNSLPGYPDTITKTEDICSMTEDQIRVYEVQYGDSYSWVMPATKEYPDGILMQISFYRTCKRK